MHDIERSLKDLSTKVEIDTKISSPIKMLFTTLLEIISNNTNLIAKRDISYNLDSIPGQSELTTNRIVYYHRIYPTDSEIVPVLIWEKVLKPSTYIRRMFSRKILARFIVLKNVYTGKYIVHLFAPPLPGIKPFLKKFCGINKKEDEIIFQAFALGVFY